MTILYFKPNSTTAEVKIRFRQLAKQYHPDHNPNDPRAASKFAAVTDEYQQLKTNRPRAPTATPRTPPSAQTAVSLADALMGSLPLGTTVRRAGSKVWIGGIGANSPQVAAIATANGMRWDEGRGRWSN